MNPQLTSIAIGSDLGMHGLALKVAGSMLE